MRLRSRNKQLYADPRRVSSLEDCRFHHSMDLPGYGEVAGDWDLRPTFDAYVGGVELDGRRALDVGAASGFLSLEMERRGAAVVSFDIGPEQRRDVVPRAGEGAEPEAQEPGEARERLVNSYWLAHAAYGSEARVHYGDVYALPSELGEFDVVVLGSLLTHLRDPLLALESAGKLVTLGGRIVVVDDLIDTDTPLQRLIPTRENGVRHAWWRSSKGMLRQMLSLLGFGEPEMSEAEHAQLADRRRRQPKKLTTCVAMREVASGGAE